MKKFILLSSLILSATFIFAQTPDVQSQLAKNGEVYFTFEAGSTKQIAELTRIISIDNVKGSTVFAYANANEFAAFAKLGIKYKPLPHPNENFNPVMLDAGQVKNTNDWDSYPTYDAYVAMMQQFETDYPALCDIDTIGYSVNGRMLLVARISDNIGMEEAEPEFFYTSSMHGDELTGAILMLRLIDSLLSAYGTDPRVTNLVNNMDIFINPMANPDGTYHGGNYTVNGAIRYNANGVDINRNFPDRIGGLHPDGNAWQPETIAFMDFAEQHEFVMSANFHGGSEVFNYPWDATYALTVDDAWWQYVGHEYADTAQAYSPSNYMNGFDDGITNGAVWYLVYGGRQDYMNFYHQCREVTIEISDTKLIPASQLNAHWEYNRRSLLNYMEQCLFGVSGMITDAITGLPMEAEVYVMNHEADSSWVYSSAQGNYHRLLAAGTYDIRYSAPCYAPQIISNVVVQDYQSTVIDIQLQPSAADFSSSMVSITPGGSVDFYDASCITPISWQWTFEGGSPSTSSLQNPIGIMYTTPGNYDVKLVISDGILTDSIVKTDYIAVKQDILITDGTASSCNAFFYDSGGPTGSYTNNEDYVMTIYPSGSNAQLKVEFTSFDVEYNSTCNYDFLLIYDGPDTGSPAIGIYCGTNSPGTIVSTDASGALTFLFHSDYSVVGSGWEALVSCEYQSFELDVSAFMEGPFNGTFMNTDLSGNGNFPMDQPYSGAPWSYGGGESLVSIPSGAVDWVLLELRDAASPALSTSSTIITRKAAILLNTGEIRDLDGISLPVFDVAIVNQLFVVVYHRNHLPVMSANALTLNSGIRSYDFTDALSKAYQNGQKEIAPGIYGMAGGDSNADGIIDSDDKDLNWNTAAGEAGYFSTDLNLDGQVNNPDKSDVWYINLGREAQLPPEPTK